MTLNHSESNIETGHSSAEKTQVARNFIPHEVDQSAKRQIGWWLMAVSAMLVALVLVGGATRLTDSGLSIVEWKPVTGMIPPLSQEVWEIEFEKYKQIPEYDLVNMGMSLDEFKTIFWWEWGHRFIARMLGFAFFIPFVYFLLKRKISKPLFPKLMTMFVLGGAQGALGWFMVMSGLSDRIDVSQYRLAAHLGLAFFIFAFMVWVALDLLLPRSDRQRDDLKRYANWSIALVVLVYVQVILGGFVAGLHAGLIFNTWPLMDGGLWTPNNYTAMEPWFLNHFENHATVQFNHRMVAYLLTIVAAWNFFITRNEELSIQATFGRTAIVLTVLIQVGLGIWTLLEIVPIWLGVLHQAGSLLAFSASLYYAQSIRKMMYQA